MPAGPRIRSNSEFGLITDNPLSAVATTFNSTRLSLFPVVSSAHAVVTLDPRAQNGEPEIVIITAHTAAATVATITRGTYGTVARSHPVNTEWVHAPIDEDFIENVAATAEITDPYRGQILFNRTNNRFEARSTSDVWTQEGLLFDPPACRVFHNAGQNYTSGTPAFVAFNSERWDNDNMHDNVTNNSRITINTAGLYLVTAHATFATQAGGNRYIAVRLNNTAYIAVDLRPGATGNATDMSIATTYRFAIADFIQLEAFQNSGTTPVALSSIANYSPEFTATWIGR